MISRRELLVAVPVLGLAACAGADPAPTFPAFRFDGGTLLLSIAELAIDNQYQPLGEGHIEGDFDVPPSRAIEDWAGDRLSAAGTSGKATVIIREASAVQERLETTQGISGVFRSEEAWKITTRLLVDIIAEDQARLTTARTTVRAERTRTLLENVTLIERRQAYYTLSGDLIREFDRQAVAAIRQNMRPFLG